MVLVQVESAKFLLRAPVEGNGNPLQYSCLGNSMDRGAWWATVRGVTRIGHNFETKPPPPTFMPSWCTLTSKSEKLCYSKCGLQTSCTGFPWELSRNAVLKCLTLKARVSSLSITLLGHRFPSTEENRNMLKRAPPSGWRTPVWSQLLHLSGFKILGKSHNFSASVIHLWKGDTGHLLFNHERPLDVSLFPRKWTWYTCGPFSSQHTVSWIPRDLMLWVSVSTPRLLHSVWTVWQCHKKESQEEIKEFIKWKIKWDY